MGLWFAVSFLSLFYMTDMTPVLEIGGSSFEKNVITF